LTIDWYLPGTNSGGPVRSVANLVAAMPNTHFYIITRNTDYCSTAPYAGIQPNTWIQVATNVRVCYLAKSQITKKNIQSLILASGAHTLYISGVYSKAFSQWPVSIGKALKLKTVVAARGMLSPHALVVKLLKKYLFLSLMRWLNAYGHVHFHATSEQEATDIKKVLGTNTNVKVVSNLGRNEETKPRPIAKAPQSLKLVSIGRIAPEKGTLQGLKALQDVAGEVTFDLFGMAYNATYWQECQQVIAGLPPNIEVRYHGPCPSEEVAEKIAAAHALLLPSEGENYGHAIVESLAQGRPVLISKHTPWQNLAAQKAGWDVKATELPSAIQSLIDMDQQSYESWSEGAKKYHQMVIEEQENTIQAYQTLFTP
ncbi:MAG: glycosyltransferase, partial [Sphingomonadales bacterium]|nr:glycosyltransferase [Sphingomonadales bacterium]